jgi:ubiquinone/menaquinone biosynthesis C-methylase UbiE
LSANYFTSAAAAKRYAKGRPFYQHLVAKRIRARCAEHGEVTKALDVGCGTGQSSVALAEFAEEVTGIDPSIEMLRHALPHPRVRYLEACAERMPFGDGAFELVTAGAAFHWFDRPAFLSKARRVLKPSGWLVIYNDGFLARMKGNDAYSQWSRENYITRFPTPPRNNAPLSNSILSESGFSKVSSDEFEHQEEFSVDTLVTYLTTQSNVISVVESGKETIDAAVEWLKASIAPMFTAPEETFAFRCNIEFLRKEPG